MFYGSAPADAWCTVNKDGTMKRIANWVSMSAREQEIAFRRIRERNHERRLHLAEMAGELPLESNAQEIIYALPVPGEGSS